MKPAASRSITVNYQQLPAVEKVWGAEYWVQNTEKYCLKVLHLKAGHKGSLHFHPVKDETFLAISGKVTVEKGDETFLLEPGGFLRISPGVKHRFSAHEDAVLVEASTHHDDGDVVRIEASV